MREALPREGQPKTTTKSDTKKRQEDKRDRAEPRVASQTDSKTENSSFEIESLSSDQPSKSNHSNDRFSPSLPDYYEEIDVRLQ